MELAQSSDFFETLLATGAFSEPVARFYFKQLIAAVEHVHAKRFCHRDIKPENLLYDQEYNLKLTDFGLASTYKNKEGKVVVHRT